MLSEQCEIEINKFLESCIPLHFIDIATILVAKSIHDMELSPEIEFDQDESLLAVLDVTRLLYCLGPRAVLNENSIESMVVSDYLMRKVPTILRQKSTADIGGE
jgi:hypothetical protein